MINNNEKASSCGGILKGKEAPRLSVYPFTFSIK
jgi:hypothetical protein